MSGGFDDYLSDLREQLARCAAAAPERARRRGAGATPASARFGRRPAPRRILAWAAVLVVGVGALAAGLVVAGDRSATPAAPGALLATPGRSLPAYVQPVIAVSPSAAGVPSATQPSYSLAAIAAISGNDVWSVGAHGDAAGAASSAPAGDGHSFVLHYDGAAWRETAVPDVGPLTAVSATSDGEAWALGPSGAIVHWDGLQWRAVLTAGRDGGAVLRGLAALAPDDVWAVGSLQGAPFATHWNGAAWRPAALPALPGGAGSLNAIAGTATGLWAVGAGADAAHVLTLRYDGTSWTPVADAGVSDGGLLTVAAVAPNDVWAAGDALLQHFDGTQWRDVSQTFSGVSEALAAAAPTSVWLAGAAGVEAFDGDDWSPVSPQALDVYKLTAPRFGAASAVSPTDVWIAGTLGASGAPSAPLIVHYDGTAWRLMVDAVQSR